MHPLYHFMNNAFEEAYKAFTLDEVPVGAVVVYKGDIIGRGHNLTQTTYDPTAHAEIIAMKQAALVLKAPFLSDCSLYVTLEPCAMCAGAIANARLNHLYFAAYDPKGGAVDHGPCLFQHTTLLHKPISMGGIEETRSVQLLKKFFQLKRGI